MVRQLGFSIHFGLVCWLLIGISTAQTDGTGTIKGFIYDEDQKPLAGVQVNARISNGPFFEKITRTESDGSYVIEGLSVGQYYVRTYNWLGYVDEFFNDVSNRQEATLIKVNKNEVVSGINFVLEKGGFITGHVYDSQNKRPLSRIDIGFVHQDSGTAQSYVTSQEDGSYISPGLPIGSYIVRAGSAPYNYILEFYNNTREQEQAQLIQVTTSDTVKGIDFYLEKGGAISGQVLEEDGVTPIPHAWVVVLREDGSWVLDIHSKADGSYVVSGLDSGKYFVQVYSVDPSRYHPEYYHDSPRLTDATPVPVTIPDTTKGIDFRLTKVVTASISNPFIEVTVCDKYPGTNLTMKNTGGLPQTSVDDEKDLLFGHPYPYTSYTTIRVDDENYIYGSNEGDLVVPPQVSSDQKFITRVWRVKNLEVAQTVSLDSSVWSLNKFEDTAKLQYTIVNRDNISHAVGIRILLDTMLGSNDGAPIMIPYSEYSDYERDFQAPNIPFWWTAIDGRPDHIIFSAQGTLRDYGATTPDRFVTAKWSNIYKHKWDYKISDTTKVIYDSAVALWWEPIALAPGASREIVTYYGLGEGIPDTVAPYLDNLHPAKNAVEVPIDTDILLHLKDSQSGVDTTTIVMTVDGARVVPKISGTPKDIILKYEPPENFKYNQRVTVGIAGVKDLAVKPNVMNPESYTFSIRQDTTAPYLSELNPAAGQRNVPLDVKMVAHIKDNLSGVDQNTIVMLLNDQQVIPQSITGDSSDYVLTYQPDKPFRYRDSVKVTIQAQDLALPHDGKTNRLEAYYTFYTIVPDTLPPYTWGHRPAKGASNVALDSAIVVHISDDSAGVDLSSIVMTVNKDTVTPVISGNKLDYTLWYKPNEGFAYNDTIYVTIDARDLAHSVNVMSTDSYCFFTMLDTLPPYTSNHKPIPYARNLPLDTVITVHVLDHQCGVDSSSLVMKINDMVIQPKVEGNKHDYFLSFYPPPGFLEYNQAIKVNINAQDLAQPPNIMETDSYFLFTQKDTLPPYVWGCRPGVGEKNMPVETSIQFHLADSLCGVDASSIKMMVEGFEVKPQLSGTPSDYLVFYDPFEDFGYNQEVNISVTAQDLSNPPNIMPVFSYAFTTIPYPDKVPPLTTGHIPARFASNVALDASIEVHLQDQLTGVDSASIVMTVEGDTVRPLISGNKSDYQLIYRPAKTFSYNDTIHITIKAQDLAYPPNVMETDAYFFTTLVDTLPPYTTDHNPAKDAQEVALTATISLHVRDNLAGVDKSSILMTVSGDTVEPTLSGTPLDYTVSYKPPIPFKNDQMIQVTITAQDLSSPPNRMQREVYSFSTKSSIAVRDTLPPYTTSHNPAPRANNVPLNAAITVHIKDDLTGVDSTSIKMYVNHQFVTPLITGNPFDYEVRYKPVENFKYNDTVRVTIAAQDLAAKPNVMKTDVYFFTTIVDTVAPYTTDHEPRKNATDVPLDSRVVLHLRDNLAGVDSSSIIITIDGSRVQPVISGTPWDYTLTYWPSAPFSHNQVVQVRVEAQDLSNPPNRMLPDCYSFTTRAKAPDIYVAQLRADQKEIKVNRWVTMLAEIGNANSDVTESFHVVFYQNDVVVKDTVILSMAKDQVIETRANMLFPAIEKYRVRVVADANNDIIESSETNNLQEIFLAVVQGDLIVRPNPFTPNNDGYNDEAVFNFAELNLKNPQLKLFTFENRNVLTLDNRGDNSFKWDGKDSQGKDLQPGVYLYLLQDGDKVVAKGYVVLAR